MKWLVCDSLYCPEQFFASHLDSYSHYLREAGESVSSFEFRSSMGPLAGPFSEQFDIVFVLDRYDMARAAGRKRIAQVAAVCNPMPWDVRNADGSPAYDLVISSIPWMVDEARAKGCRAEYLPLAFDTRARVAGMGVKRDLDCIFIGTVGPNHKRRAELLRELSDIVTVLPPVFGRAYFKTLARAKVVFNVHAEWSRGAANNMRMFEAAGMGCQVVSDGQWPGWIAECGWPSPAFSFEGAREAEDAIRHALSMVPDSNWVWHRHTYEFRIPRLIELARSI